MSRKTVRIVDLEEARSKLGKLIDALKPGQWFIISVNGAPKVKVLALTDKQKETPATQKK
jgi:antitoxin (DNA-binding transcriptional repressor) of toxin-antitoxin stability system